MRWTLVSVIVIAAVGQTAIGQAIDDVKVFTNDGASFLNSFADVTLANPSGVAWTSDHAACYVADYESNSIHVFDSGGACLFTFSGGDLSKPTGLAVAPDDAVLYVCSEGTNDVKVFDAVGGYLFAFGSDRLSQPADVAVTSDGAAVYVASRGAADILVFDAVGSFLFPFAAHDLHPAGLSRTSDDAALYAASSSAIQVYDAVGQDLGAVASVHSPSDVIVALDDAVLYAVSIGQNAVVAFDNQGTALFTLASVAQLNGRSQLAMSADDAAFTVSNFGRVPLRGDLNCDGTVNFGDIDGFVLALTSPTAYQEAYPNCDIRNADINQDCQVDFKDIDPFVAILSGG